MNSSGKATRSAPSRAASARARARLVGVAGDVADGRIELRDRDREAVGRAGVHGLDVAWRRARFANAGMRGNRRAAARHMPGPAARASAEEPAASARRCSSAQPDRGRAHVLDPADLRIDLARHPVGELFDRGVQQFDHEQEQRRRRSARAASRPPRRPRKRAAPRARARPAPGGRPPRCARRRGARSRC